MKIEYLIGRTKNSWREVSDRDKQIITDYLLRKISLSQAQHALKINPKSHSAIYVTLSRVLQQMIRDGDIKILKDDF